LEDLEDSYKDMVEGRTSEDHPTVFYMISIVHSTYMHYLLL